MTALEARRLLTLLHAERVAAVAAGLAGNPLYLDDLEEDITAARQAYVSAAVTEIAVLRAQLSGPQLG